MRHGRRSHVNREHLHESLTLYRLMERAESDGEFQRLLAEHDRCTDADGLPRLVSRTLEEFRRGPGLRDVARVPPSRPHA
jgi:hypothetical protein